MRHPVPFFSLMNGELLAAPRRHLGEGCAPAFGGFSRNWREIVENSRARGVKRWVLLLGYCGFFTF